MHILDAHKYCFRHVRYLKLKQGGFRTVRVSSRKKRERSIFRINKLKVLISKFGRARSARKLLCHVSYRARFQNSISIEIYNNLGKRIAKLPSMNDFGPRLWETDRGFWKKINFPRTSFSSWRGTGARKTPIKLG